MQTPFISELTAYFSELVKNRNFPEHTPENHGIVLSLLSDFLRDLDASDTEQVILEQTRSLIEALNRLNEAIGGGLLETLERDIIVSGVLEAIAQAGVNLNRFDYRDPTLEYREF